MSDEHDRHRLRAMTEIAGAVAAATDLDPLLAAIVATGSRLFGTPDFYLYLRDDATGTLYSPFERSERHRGYHAEGPANRYYPPNPPLALAVAQEGVPIVVRDYEDACRARGLVPIDLPDNQRPLGWLGVPMLLDGRVLGIFATHAPRRQYDATEVETLSAIATQTALAIAHFRLTAEAQQCRDEFAAVAELVNIGTLGLPPEDTLDRLAGRMRDLTNCRALGMVLFDDSGMPWLRAQRGLPEGYVAQVQATIDALEDADGSGWPPLAAARSGAVCAARLEELPPAFAFVAEEGVRAGWRTVIGMPLRARGRLVGALSCYLGEAIAPDEHLRRLLQLLADQTAVTVENARLYSEARERASELEAIFRSIPDRVSIYDRDGRHRMENVAASRVGRQGIIDAPADRVKHWRLRSEDGTPLVADQLPSARALRGEIVPEHVLIVDNGRNDVYISETGAPIYDADGRITGAVTVGRDVTEQRRAEQQREALRATIEDIGAQLDLGPLLETLIARAVQLIGGDGGAIVLIDPADGSARLEATHNLPGVAVGFTLEPGMGIAARVMEQRAPVIIEDYEALPKPVPIAADRIRHGTVAAPVWWQEKIIGTLSVISTDPEHRFTAADADLLATFARHAAIAIANARLYDAVRASEERFRALTQSAPDIIYALDTERRITYVNDRVTDVLGYTPAEVIGLPAIAVVAPESYEPFKMYHDIADGAQAFARGELIARDGTRVPVEIHTSLLTVDGQVVGVQGIARDIRETVRLEEELHQRASELEAVFRSIPDGIKIFDTSGTLRMMNAAATRVARIGDRSEHRLARYRFRARDGRPLTIEELPSARALAGETVTGQELIFDIDDGDYIFNETAAPMHDERGRIRGAVVVSRDVTEQRRAEQQREALRATVEDIGAELDLRPLLETLIARAVQLVGGRSGVIILIDPMDGSGCIEAVHNVRAALLGTRIAPGAGMTSLVLERRAPVIVENYEALQRPAIVFAPELRDHPTIAVPIWWQGAIIGTLIVLASAPERRFTAADADLLATFARHAAIAITNGRLYDAVRASEERFRALAGSAPDIIYTLDTERRITYVNDRMTDVLGYAPDEVIGRSAFEIVAPESYEPFQMHADQPLTANTFARGELIARDGARIPVEIRTSLLTVDGQVVGVQGIARDIRQTVALEAAVQERTRTVAAIAERQRLARELHDSVTQTLFSMTLIARAASRQHAKAPERAGDSLTQLSGLAQGALAEMRSLLFQLRPEAIADAGLVEAVKKHVAAVESRDSLAVSLVVTGEERRDGASLLAPRQMEALYRITQEALANVVKHARATRATVTLSFTPGEVALVVADDGIGYAAASATRRPDLPTGASGGMGLRGIRERLAPLHGTLAIESTPGVGTTLRVTLPTVPPEEVPA